MTMKDTTEKFFDPYGDFLDSHFMWLSWYDDEDEEEWFSDDDEIFD